jgi:hypothetical protein
MNYKLTTPCSQCPFLKSMAHGFPLSRLAEFAEGAFHCHRTGRMDEETGDYIVTKDSQACAGALIFLEKRGMPNQMMRIAERFGVYDHSRLDMEADVR